METIRPLRTATSILVKAAIPENGTAGQQVIHRKAPSSVNSFDILYYRKQRLLSTAFPGRTAQKIASAGPWIWRRSVGAEFKKKVKSAIFLIFHNKVNHIAALLSLQCVSSDPCLS